ncbi:unnamed protein product [Ceutorhynchus assimilis]|uniref:Uncharacterized protein n=1 Tax=Ceutorhynchus assimilis TaxID=467358 RepID=A0A9P0GQL3_9CUCU|nr:unnamed protein product [Ceutorhynchus assimilis]
MAKRKRSYHVGKNNNLRSKSLRAHFRRKIPAVALDHTYAAYARDPYSVAGKSSRARLASDFRESMCYDVNHDTPIIKEEISREILTGSDFQDEDNNKDNSLNMFRYKLGYSPLDSLLIIKEEEEEEEVPSTSGTDPLQFVKQEGESECSQHRNESFPLRYSPGYSPLIIKEEAREEVSSTSGTSPLPFIDQEGKSENFQDRNGSFPLRYSPSIIIKEEAGEENPSTSGTNPLLDQEGESEDFQHRNGSFSLRESPTMYYDLNHDTPIIKEEISTNSDFQDEDKEYNFEYSPLIIKEEAREEVPSTPGTDRLQFVEQEGGSENFQHRNGSFTLRIMDEQWNAGSKNVVYSSELKATRPIREGSSVKMLYHRKWYSETDIIESDDSNNIPLSEIRQKVKSTHVCSNNNNEYSEGDNIPLHQLTTKTNELVQSSTTNLLEVNNHHLDESPVTSPEYDLDQDPPFGICEARKCKGEVFSSCHVCNILLCWEHFIADTDKCLHFGHGVKSLHITSEADMSVQERSLQQDDCIKLKKAACPEDFLVEQNPEKKVKKVNKQKEAKRLRNCGQEYFSPSTKKIVPAKVMKQRCMSRKCSKTGKKCSEIEDQQRERLFSDYYSLANLTRQRDFLIHHVTKEDINRKTVKTKSRRTSTLKYCFTVDHNRLPVCKKFFLNTLGISEKPVLTALHKTSDMGILEEEKRGGRQRSQKVLIEEEKMRNEMSDHIDKYPKMESHCCRDKSSRMYLHPDLTLQKMYDMFREDLMLRDIQKKPCVTTFRKILKSKNLSFYHPKKDQCSLCLTFRGDEKVKQEMKEVFEKLIEEKSKSQ